MPWMWLRPVCYDGFLCLFWARLQASKKHAALKTYQEVDRLDDVQENLVLPVLDALWPPGDGVGDRGRRPRSARVQLVTFLRDVSVKNQNFPSVTPEWHLLGQRKAWKYFSAASFETKQWNDLKTFKWMSVVWFEGEWAETVRKRKLNTELTPGGSCCLWFAGIQSPWVHPAARRLWQSYLWCSPPPAP